MLVLQALEYVLHAAACTQHMRTSDVTGQAVSDDRGVCPSQESSAGHCHVT